MSEQPTINPPGVLLRAPDGKNGDNGTAGLPPSPPQAANGDPAVCGSWKSKAATNGTPGKAGDDSAVDGTDAGREGNGGVGNNLSVTVNTLLGAISFASFSGSGGKGGDGANGGSGQNGGNGGKNGTCSTQVAPGGPGGNGGRGGRGGNGGNGGDGGTVTVLYNTANPPPLVKVAAGSAGGGGSAGFGAWPGQGGLANGGKGNQAPDGQKGRDGSPGQPGFPGQGGTATAVAIAPLPQLLSLSPSQGPVAGGTAFTLTGVNLKQPQRVCFGSAEVSDVTVNPAGTMLTGTTPAGTGPGAVTVTAAFPGGYVAALVQQFTYSS
jgi:hypothetical protein